MLTAIAMSLDEVKENDQGNVPQNRRLEKKGHTVQILKCEELETWMLMLLGLSDQIIFPFIISFAGSTYISFGLLVSISCTFLFVSFCILFTMEIVRTDPPCFKNCCL